jgi:uncharacterized protein YeaO (DUF488 family)
MADGRNGARTSTRGRLGSEADRSSGADRGSGSGSGVGTGTGTGTGSHFRVKRVYDDPSPQDGFRVLVDRLWPRGISKERAGVDEWAKDIAPSGELRKWFHTDRDRRYDEFATRYAAELDASELQDRLEALRERAAEQTVTLLTAAKDAEHSHVPVLMQSLER